MNIFNLLKRKYIIYFVSGTKLGVKAFSKNQIIRFLKNKKPDWCVEKVERFKRYNHEKK